jgi:hypothetical protein
VGSRKTTSTSGQGAPLAEVPCLRSSTSVFIADAPSSASRTTDNGCFPCIRTANNRHRRIPPLHVRHANNHRQPMPSVVLRPNRRRRRRCRPARSPNTLHRRPTSRLWHPNKLHRLRRSPDRSVHRLSPLSMRLDLGRRLRLWFVAPLLT